MVTPGSWLTTFRPSYQATATPAGEHQYLVREWKTGGETIDWWELAPALFRVRN
jgi:hypothetical protein